MNKMFLFGMMETIAVIFVIAGIFDGNNLMVTSHAVLAFLATCIPGSTE